jgi:carbonic anhydrase/acetyltransferase-like protein (isoleucine patch superfamily)
MNKKYELTDESIEIPGHILYRIKALRDFSDVKEGDLGGFIEKEFNLSHDDNCWIYRMAKIFDNACVCDNARVFGKASVHGTAHVYDNAVVCGDAYVYNNAQVFGDASIYGNAQISDTAWISGNARVSGYTTMYEKSKISGNCILKINDWTYLYDINLDHGIWIDSCIVDNKKYIISNTLEKLYIGDVG